MLIVHEADSKTQPGQAFEMLTVLGREFRIRQNSGELVKCVVCECQCGKIRMVRVHSLLDGGSKSCGSHHSTWPEDEVLRRERSLRFRTKMKSRSNHHAEDLTGHATEMVDLTKRKMPSKEEWRGVAGWPGYRVNAWGVVQGCRRTHGKWIDLKQANSKGYLVISLADKHIGQKAVGVHRLVAAAFLGDSNGRQVRHLNGDKTDNRLLNLFYGSAKQNADDRSIHGTVARGERNGSAKVNEQVVREIRSRFERGDEVTAIAEDAGLSISHVCDIAKGRAWKHVSN